MKRALILNVILLAATAGAQTAKPIYQELIDGKWQNPITTPTIGHWVWNVEGRFWDWAPPAYCKTWPEGLSWAGLTVYDKNGCVYPKSDGRCMPGQTLPAFMDCREAPPVPVPNIGELCGDGTKCVVERGEGGRCVCTPTSATITVLTGQISPGLVKVLPATPVEPPLKCGKYQHVEHWAGRCGPAQCGPSDGMYSTCNAMCAPPPPDHCSDDMHLLTERDYQTLKSDLQKLEGQMQETQARLKALEKAPVTGTRMDSK